MLGANLQGHLLGQWKERGLSPQEVYDQYYTIFFASFKKPCRAGMLGELESTFVDL